MLWPEVANTFAIADIAPHILETLADLLLSLSGPDTNPRVHEVLSSLVRHLHAFAQEVGLTHDDWRKSLELLTLGGESLDADSDEEPDSYAPSAYLRDEQADPAQALERDDWEAQTTSQLGAALEQLDPRSRAIVQRRWLSDDKPTLHDLAAEYQVSAERIRQLETNAMKKLRAALPTLA